MRVRKTSGSRGGPPPASIESENIEQGQDNGREMEMDDHETENTPPREISKRKRHDK